MPPQPHNKNLASKLSKNMYENENQWNKISYSIVII